MQKTNRDPFLNHAEYIRAIKGQPEFIDALGGPLSDSIEELTIKRKTAVALGAKAAAEHFRQSYGEYDIKPRILDTVGQLDAYYVSEGRLGAYREKRQNRLATDRDYYQPQDDKEVVTEFNHTLREVIEACSGRFSFNELLTFMTNMHTAISGPKSQKDFYEKARSTLVGMRNEIATEASLLRHGDYDIEMGTVEDDATGGDIFIDGVPFDVKSSQISTQRARLNAIEHGDNPNLIIWSHIKPEDYQGALMLSDENLAKAAQGMIPEIDAALMSTRSRYVA